MVNTLTVDNEAKQTIEALQTELQKTKEKLKAVEELKSQSGTKTEHCNYSGCKGLNVLFQKRVGNTDKRGFTKENSFKNDFSVCGIKC